MTFDFHVYGLFKNLAPLYTASRGALWVITRWRIISEKHFFAEVLGGAGDLPRTTHQQKIFFQDGLGGAGDPPLVLGVIDPTGTYWWPRVRSSLAAALLRNF